MPLYPRQVNVLGAEDRISCLGILSKLNTCGVLVLGRAGGANPNGVSPTGPDETYIYLNGVAPATPMAGGVTEIMTNPAGGAALGAAVAQTPFDPSRARGFTLLGSDRVSSSVKICGHRDTAKPGPALGIMYYAAGQKIMYIYVGTGGYLCYGDEAAWQASDATNKMALSVIPKSGTLGNLRDGRTVIGNDDGIGGALVIASGGKSGAVGFLSGDHQTAVMMYVDATPKPVFGTAAAWLAYAGS